VDPKAARAAIKKEVKDEVEEVVEKDVKRKTRKRKPSSTTSPATRQRQSTSTSPPGTYYLTNSPEYDPIEEIGNEDQEQLAPVDEVIIFDSYSL
jgi:hypothetical protein